MNLNKTDYVIQNLVEVTKLVFFFFLAKNDQMDWQMHAHVGKLLKHNTTVVCAKCSALVTHAN